jgi:hypothetical protein
LLFINKKAKSCGKKHYIFPHKTLWIATNHFLQSLSFWSPTQFLFPLWNIGSIIPLIFIIYLALVHNYNTIKYICFINPRQRPSMPSRNNIKLVICVKKKKGRLQFCGTLDLKEIVSPSKIRGECLDLFIQ